MARIRFFSIIGAALVLAAGAPLPAAQEDPAKIPVSVFTWAGKGTGFGASHNQNKLAGPLGSTDIDYYPSTSSLPKIGKADIAYIRNHGGVVQTNPFFPGLQGGFKKTKFVDMGLPEDDDKGPSAVMAWGCQNGRPDLIEKYAKGFGVRKDSKTKFYIGPTFDVPATESDFPSFFFAEFSKGDVTAREAARIAYEKWAALWGAKARQDKNFDRDIGIWGNGDLTLNDIRRNLAARRGPPAAPPKPTAPESSKAVLPARSFPADALIEREYWDADKKVLKREYAYIKNGARKVRHGLERRYYQSGALEYEAVRKLDVLEGPLVRYWANAQVFDIVNYKNGGPEGAYEAFHDNGQPRAKGQFKGGRKVGEWTTWHRTGALESAGSYVGDFYLVERIPPDLQNINDIDKGLYHPWGPKIGKWRYGYPSGRKQAEETFGPEGGLTKPDGELFAPRTTWYDNAENSLESEDVPGPNGYRSKNYDNGQIAEKCPREGKCRSWHRDGTEIKD